MLGINAYHGDAAAGLVENGKILAACEEERFRRIKHCAGFPTLAIRACLKEGNLTFDDLDFVSISRNPMANFSKKALYAVRQGKKLSAFFKKRLSTAFKVADLREQLRSHLDLKRPPRAKIAQIEHHLSHMSSSFFPSPFDEAAILSIDGFGDFVSTKWGYGTGKKIKVLGQVEFPHSVGIFYTALTQYLGFRNYGDEYKVMGLAAYGKPRFESEFRQIIVPDFHKGFQINLDYFIHHSQGIEMNWDDGAPTQSLSFSRKLEELFGPARHPEEPITDRHRDLAASLQNAFEEVYFHLLNQLYLQTKSINLCLAGGCAFNSLANGKICAQTPFQNIFVQPAAGDAGTAIGSALYEQHAILGKSHRFRMDHVYLGPRFDDSEIKNVLNATALPFQELDENEMIEFTADALANGKIVGWFQGRMEYGPRALGNRSLLADPRRPEMKNILNERIKHREEFRPFAPSILREEIREYFEETQPEPFMTSVRTVKTEKRKLIPAVTHVDGTARLHTVDREINPKYWKLIHAFKQITGIPLLLNTSFNENEPIVSTPQEALECFQRTDMDYLAIENFLIARNKTRGKKEKVGSENVILAR